MLQLRGTASYVRGFETSLSSEVLRICRPTSEPRDAADAALASGPEELLTAQRSGFTRAVLLGDHREFERSSIPNLLVVSQEFSYLADGDIVGIQPRTGKLRSLYRRG